MGFGPAYGLLKHHSRRLPAQNAAALENPTIQFKGILLEDPGVLLKGPGVFLKDPGVLLKNPGVL